MHDTCPNCEALLATPYCPGCGQKAIPPDDLTLRRGWSHLTHELWHLDGRLPTTLKGIFLHPGEASLDFLEGRRARHMHPVQVFILFSGLHFLTLQKGFLPGIFTGMADSNDEHGSKQATTVQQRLPQLESAIKTLDYAALFLMPLLATALMRKHWPHYGQRLVFFAHRACWLFGIETLWFPLNAVLSPRLHFAPNSTLQTLVSLTPYLVFPLYTYAALRRAFALPRSEAAGGALLLATLGAVLTFVTYSLAFWWGMR